MSLSVGVGVRLGGGAALPLPQAASIIAKWDAGTLGLSDGAAVASWADTIAGYTGTQGTGANQPIFKANQFGGLPTVRFDGVNDVLQCGRPAALVTAVDTNQVFTLVVVCRVVSAKSNGMVFGAANGGNAFQMTASGAAMGRYNGGSSTLAYPSNGSGFNVMMMTSQKPYATGSGTGLERQYLQGTCYAANVAPCPTTGGFNFAMGALAAGTLPANVDIAEVIMWNTALSLEEGFTVVKRLCDKYAQPYPWAGAPSIAVCHGDSQTQGVGSTNVANTYPYLLAANLSKPLGTWTNAGIGGMKMRDMVNEISQWTGIASVTGKPLRVAAFEYYNERATSPATLQGYHTSYAAAVRATGAKLCIGSSISSTLDPDSNRSSLNTWLDTNGTIIADTYVALHNNTHIGISGAAATDANVTYFYDGIHTKNAGAAEIATDMAVGVTALG